MENYTPVQLLLISLFLFHVFFAFFGTVSISTISTKLLPNHLKFKILCWILPLFGILILFRGGKYVPPMLSTDFALVASKSHEESKRNIEERGYERDSSLPVSSSGHVPGGHDAAGDGE